MANSLVPRPPDSMGLSEDSYRLLFDESPLPIWLFDPQSYQLLAVNDAAVDLYSYTRAELLAMKVTRGARGR